MASSSDREYREELHRFLSGLGENVRRLRTEHDPAFSQDELAEAARLHRTAIGKIERGLVDPRSSTLSILAATLGTTVNGLLVDLDVPVQRKPRMRPKPFDLEAPEFGP